MTVSDWINIIRWKYFTNQKAGLIFKELMGEFRMVDQMTKKERYNIIESEHTMPFVYDGDDKLAEVHSDDVERLCDLLNKQNAEIKRLKKENQGLQFKIIDMLDFVKEKGTVTREEIKKWWNGDVE